MNARMILASVAGALLLASPIAASATSTKDSKTTTTSAPAKPAKEKKVHKTAKPKPATKKDDKSAK